MKNLVPWLKAHWIIPVLTLVALAVLPTAWYFADDMHTKDLAAFQDRVGKDFDSVDQRKNAMQIYYIPSVDGSGHQLEKTAVVNEATIKRYGEIWAEVQSKIGGVSEKGIAFNKGDHKLLIDGLFLPATPDRITADNKGREFIERNMQFHKLLLTEMKAGEPAKAEDIAKQLSDRLQTEEQRVRAELGRDLNPEERAKLTEELVGLRLAALRKRAAEISVYADGNIFDGVPTSIPEKAPTVVQCWDMQVKSWIDQDICRAIALANAKASAGVPESVVKRITKIAIRPALYSTGDQAPQPALFDAGDDKPPLDFSASITGRVSGPGRRNRWYDVRPVTLEIVVSSARLPQFVTALSATNFIAVLDLDLTKVEPLADLREGFDYGDEHVVRASIVVETIWLRDWRKQAMPMDVQKALGMVEGVDAPGGAPIPAAAPPPSPRTRPAPGTKPPGGPGGKPPPRDRDG